MNQQRGNLSSGERAGSALLGLGFTILAARGGGPLLRILAGIAGTSLVARAAAGHCAMKAAVTGESSFKEGLAEQWRRTSETGRRLSERAESAMKRASDSGLHAAADGSETLDVAADMASGASESESLRY